MTPTESAALTQQTGWTPRQRNHLRRLMREGAIIAYWCSDAHGRPANHEMEPLQECDWTARPGLVQEVAGPLATCSSRALHATMEPHLWAGVRVWLVGLVGQVRTDQDAKMGALRREIVGECIDVQAGSVQHGCGAVQYAIDVDRHLVPYRQIWILVDVVDQALRVINIVLPHRIDVPARQGVEQLPVRVLGGVVYSRG